MNPSTVLVVGRNPLLPQVVRHLLPDSPTVLAVDNLDEALPQIAQPPRLALLELPGDDCSSDQPLKLRAHLGPVPLVLLAGNPSALPAFPPEWKPAPRVLPQAPDLGSLKQTLDQVWQETDQGKPAKPSRVARLTAFLIGLIVVAGGLLLLLPLLRVPYVPDVLKMVVGRREAVSAPPATTVHPIEGKQDTFLLEKDAAVAMKIPKPFRIGSEPERRQLTLSGSLAFDPDLLGRVQSRFQGEVISIGRSEEPVTDPRGRTKDATLSYGNRVRKGQLMAIVWSKDLGEKKSELVDWLVKLSLDEENSKRLEELWLSGAGSEATYRAAKNAVSADLNGVARARRTLETWRVDDAEIKEIEKEAERIVATKTLRELNQQKSKIGKWAQVEVRAPFDGIIVEKNLAIGNIVDPSQDLFRVADLRKLAVFANAYEEDQRLLQDLQAQLRPAPVPWRVHLTADPDKKPLASEGIERIGYIVDPNQRTNLAIGKVDNKDDRLRVGQSVTALVNIPAPKGVVSIPASALVEDGADSVVFVQPDPDKLVYEMRRVAVVQRFNVHPLPEMKEAAAWSKAAQPEQWAYVRSVLDDKQKKAGLRELKPGERILASAVVELKAALEEVQARDRSKR
jgi:cobalt-zinc-cadmium efflux system membrane fusion protein